MRGLEHERGVRREIAERQDTQAGTYRIQRPEQNWDGGQGHHLRDEGCHSSSRTQEGWIGLGQNFGKMHVPTWVNCGTERQDAERGAQLGDWLSRGRRRKPARANLNR